MSGSFNTSSKTRHVALAGQLLELEKALRESNYWTTQVPTDQEMQSDMPFACDVMELEVWLQWIFIPRMKIMIAHEAPLPKASIYEYAEETLGKKERVESIMHIIKRIDRVLA